MPCAICGRAMPDRRTVARQRLADPLWPTGRPGRVEHLLALALVGDRVSGSPGHVGVPSKPRLAPTVAVDRVEIRQLGSQLEPASASRHRRRGHEHTGAAVVEDVLHFGGAEVTVDRRVVHAAALRPPRDVEELRGGSPSAARRGRPGTARAGAAGGRTGWRCARARRSVTIAPLEPMMIAGWSGCSRANRRGW